MLIKKPSNIRSSEITDKKLFMDRRAFLGGAVALAAAAAVPLDAFANDKIPNVQKSQFSTSEKPNSYKDITNYNNYYEFSTDKYEPAGLSKDFRTRPWTVKIDGDVQKSKTLDIDTLLKLAPQEERIYRHRCVEGWSMVIPWVGYSLSNILKQVEPLGKAKYVEFTSDYDVRQMPGARSSVLDWPYTEGLRLDEAMHPLTLMVFGLYGEILPNVNGAPLRIHVPWKYGFKSAKSIVRIRFTSSQPGTAWNKEAPNEYGFYSNVNPQVDHPRWSQKKERRIGEFLKRDTILFNGYGDQVASMYNGMDLKKNF